MIFEEGILTIGANPVQISALSYDPKVCCLVVQAAPGNTGNCKVSVNPNVTSDNTTGGIFLAPTDGVNPDSSVPPGGSYPVEDKSGKNSINALDFYYHGTHSGDKLMWQVWKSV